MPALGLGKMLALLVAIVCLVLIVLTLASLGGGLPAWIVFLLIGVLAVAIVV